MPDAETVAPMPLQIERSRWVRGDKGGLSLMRNDQGNMCCLGFLALACGYSPAELDDVADPESVACRTRKDLFPKGTFGMVIEHDQYRRYPLSGTVQQLISVNDRAGYSPGDEMIREETIAGLMADLNVAVTFVD